ncbi:MAG TPA: hypothetical protein VGR03_05670, partial [Candidatus Acidoferrum sp.]|nr:hypothetical protein [Candidatus Acidoferrum sp.]
MKGILVRSLAVLLSLILLPAPDWATCGGGGGGGMGGMGGGGTSDQKVYTVPWKLIKPGDPP